MNRLTIGLGEGFRFTRMGTKYPIKPAAVDEGVGNLMETVKARFLFIECAEPEQVRTRKHDETSKFLSFVLRHQPDAIGITLDREGWTEIAALIVAAGKDGKHLDRDLIEAVVATSDKKRFAISEDGLRIRAVQGHSTVAVDISFDEQVPPEFLYDGTTTRFLDSIRKAGLLPGSRQYVHLSQDEETALAVGQRHGAAVVLKVHALAMHDEGYQFFQAENGVWLTGVVPAFLIKE